MNDYIVEDGSFINSIVGEDTLFKGELNLSGLLRIDGDYSGVIRTSGKVLIGKNGRAECSIYAGTVVVGGVIKGNIYASEKVIVLSTGMVIGNIHTPRLIVEEGVIFHGECFINKDYTLEMDQTDQDKRETGKGEEHKDAKEDEKDAGEEEIMQSDSEASLPDNTEEITEEKIAGEKKEISAWKG